MPLLNLNKLNNKLLLFWSGSLLLSLLLIGLLFRYMLTELYSSNASRYITQAYISLQEQIANRMEQTKDVAAIFASRSELIASMNMINKYEDRNNYQAILFDVEKSRIARESGRLIQSNNIEHVFIQNEHAGLVTLATKTSSGDNHTKGAGIHLYHSSYDRGELKFLHTQKESGTFTLASYPNSAITISELIRIPSKPRARLFVANNTLHIESLTPITQSNQGGIVGWIHLVDTLDEEFFNSVMQRYKLEYFIKLPGGESSGNPRLQTAEQHNIPLLTISTKTTPQWYTENINNFFTGSTRLPLDSGETVLLSIGVKNESLTSTIELFSKAMWLAVFFIVFILAPIGYLFLRRFVSSPVDSLVNSIKSLSKDTVDLNLKDAEQDELSFLAASVQSMSQAIKEREDALQYSEARVRILLNSTAEAIYGIDTNGLCTFANPACAKLLGFQSTQQLLGQYMHQLAHHSDTNGRAVAFKESHIYLTLSRGTGTHSDKEVLWHRDGTCFPAEYWSFPIYEDKNISGAVVTFIDITERKRNEKELSNYRENLEELVNQRTQELIVARDQATEASRTKSEFLANVSHELRTPLNSIIGFTAIIQDGMTGPVTEEQSRQLAMVYSSAKHLLGLINDILNLSKVEAGKLSLYNETFELQTLLEELLKSVEPMAGVKNLKLIIEIQDAPKSLYSDRVKLHQILLNLVSNAIKFTEKGTITIRCLLAQASPRELLIEVIDTGIGMDEENQQRIFEAFQQIDGSDSRRYDGTGLGLTISKSYVALMQGTISVSSQLGAGSCFSVRLPIAKPQKVTTPKTNQTVTLQ